MIEIGHGMVSGSRVRVVQRGDKFVPERAYLTFWRKRLRWTYILCGPDTVAKFDTKEEAIKFAEGWKEKVVWEGTNKTEWVPSEEK